MKPTVGRIVHYQQTQQPLFTPPDAALVCGVNADGTVALWVFSNYAHGLHYRDKVEFSESVAPGCWSWPAREPALAFTQPGPLTGGENVVERVENLETWRTTMDTELTDLIDLARQIRDLEAKLEIEDRERAELEAKLDAGALAPAQAAAPEEVAS